MSQSYYVTYPKLTVQITHIGQRTSAALWEELRTSKVPHLRVSSSACFRKNFGGMHAM